MRVKYNRVKDLNRLSIEYLCRDWDNYIIAVFLGDSIDSCYFEINKLNKDNKQKLIDKYKELEADVEILICLNESDPYQFARNYIQKYFNQ